MEVFDGVRDTCDHNLCKGSAPHCPNKPSDGGQVQPWAKMARRVHRDEAGGDQARSSSPRLGVTVQISGMPSAAQPWLQHCCSIAQVGSECRPSA